MNGSNRGAGVGIGLALVAVAAVVVYALSRKGAEAPAEAAYSAPEGGAVPGVSIDYQYSGSPSPKIAAQTPADLTMQQEAAKSYAARENEALAAANEEALAEIAIQKAQGLSVLQQADQAALDALVRVEKAKASGNISDLGYWASGYMPGTSNEAIVKDVQKAAESQLASSVAQNKANEAIKSGSENVKVTGEEVAAAKGNLITYGDEVYARTAGSYGGGYMKVGTLESTEKATTKATTPSTAEGAAAAYEKMYKAAYGA
jgi:hypothetical protein